MAHKRPKGTSSLFMTASSSLMVRPVAPTIMGPQTRRNTDGQVCSCQSSGQFGFHSRRPGLNGFVSVEGPQRDNVDLVRGISNPRPRRWQEGWGSHKSLTAFSSTTNPAPSSGREKEAQDLEEDCLQEISVARTADLSPVNRKRQDGQKSVELPLFIPVTPTTPSHFATDGVYSRWPNVDMPRSGYDTTNMLMAVNPRPAASSGFIGHTRNDRAKGDGNKHRSGNGNNGGARGRGKGNGRDDIDNASKKPAEQEPERGNKDGGTTTEEPIDDVRIPLEGRGWTFWL
jgi:hypothetical protein